MSNPCITCIKIIRSCVDFLCMQVTITASFLLPHGITCHICTVTASRQAGKARHDFQTKLGCGRESGELRRQLVQATSELQAVQREASEAQAAAAERQKRFTVLNSTFRRREEALISRAEAAEGALSQARSEAGEAKQQAVQALQVTIHPRPVQSSRSGFLSAVA